MDPDIDNNNDSLHDSLHDSNQNCPVCNISFPVSNLFFHILYNHPTFLLVWSSVMNPNRYTESYAHTNNTIWNNNSNNLNINNATNMTDMTDTTDTTDATDADDTNDEVNDVNDVNDTNSFYSQLNIYGQYLPNYINTIENNNNYDRNYDNYEYEFLMSLCDRIGVTTIGVKNIDESAPIVDMSNINILYEEKDICPICLVNLNELSPLRKIKNCGHMYCSYCIETWLKINRKCPICKQYACNNDIDITYDDVAEDTYDNDDTYDTYDNDDNDDTYDTYDNDDNTSLPDLIAPDTYEAYVTMPPFDFGLLIPNNFYNTNNNTAIYNIHDVD